MFLDGPSFVEYWRNFRGRTMRVLDRIPAEDLEWTHLPGKYTFGDAFRHLAGIERYMYGETVSHRPSAYSGHSAELGRGPDGIRAYMDRCHAESLEIFGRLSPEDLTSKCRTPSGTPITVWKWLRAMVEHEAHHRGQLYLMAGMRGISVPPLYGLTEEEVVELSEPTVN
jgi:uncharacterized damage-inducible protein DinB